MMLQKAEDGLTLQKEGTNYLEVLTIKRKKHTSLKKKIFIVCLLHKAF